ncbi:hypothetical protein GJ496_004135 [Pomphorhynchus laevis]|nr:hypothetical protein GJ496_004135 [Pomphorhynchus laevis]
MVRIHIDKCLNALNCVDRLRNSGCKSYVDPDLDAPVSSAINWQRSAEKSSHSSLISKPMSAPSQLRPPVNKHNDQNCESDSNAKSQNALSPAGEASSRLRELIRQKRIHMR